MDYHFAVIGPQSAGKSTFIRWLNGETSTSTKCTPTLSAQETTLHYGSKKRFCIEYPSTYDNSQKAENSHTLNIYIFDLTSKNAVAEFSRNAPRNDTLIIATKSDEKRVVTDEMFYNLCQEYHFKISTSVAIASIEFSPELVWQKIEAKLTRHNNSNQAILGEVKQHLNRNTLFYGKLLDLENSLNYYLRRDSRGLLEALNHYLLFLKNNFTTMNPDDLENEQQALIKAFNERWKLYTKMHKDPNAPRLWYEHFSLPHFDLVVLLMCVGAIIGLITTLIIGASATSMTPIILALILPIVISALIPFVYEAILGIGSLIYSKIQYCDFKENTDTPIEDGLKLLLDAYQPDFLLEEPVVTPA